jgi:nucleotide-binding universal stress UspA family protein
MFKRIFVPIDGTPRSNRAVRAAVTLARGSKGTLTLFHATALYHPPYMVSEGYAFDWPPPSVFQKEAAAAAAKVLAKAKKIATARKVAAKVAQSGSDTPARAILLAARKARADTIVMASHGRTGMEKLLLGSETQKVLAQAKIPVLVVR